MNRLSSILMVLFILFCVPCLQGQSDFFLNGSATADDSCFQLTSTVDWQVGSIWHGEKINLNESFKVAIDLFAGCKDEDGADGIVFGLQPISTSIGTGGGDLGFADVAPSLGVEFDTYQNADYGDPIVDHIAIVRDGDVKHNSSQGSLAGPISASANVANIEDCQYHSVNISWDATAQTLSVYFDCQLRLTYTGDIVNEIFDGDPFVFWGFTAATGGLNNIQEVCFTYTSFLNGLVDQAICPGMDTPLEASGGVSYNWSPATGLSDPTIANPIASPEATTLYTVEIIDDCGNSFYDDVLITVENDQFEVEIMSTPNNLSEVSLGTELILSAHIIPSSGENYTYSWSSILGSTFSDSDSSLTSMTSSTNQVGTETITVWATAENGCIAESSITFEIQGFQYDIPNVFTPDGDSTNDVFGIITEATIEEYHCKIFNRWGQVVFETNNLSESWDGTYKDKAAPSDVYIYFIYGKIGAMQLEEKGDVTLIR